MVRAADHLKGRLRSADEVQVSLTGASGMWSDFNTANRTAMLKSEVICWPVTLRILRKPPQPIDRINRMVRRRSAHTVGRWVAMRAQ